MHFNLLLTFSLFVPVMGSIWRLTGSRAPWTRRQTILVKIVDYDDWEVIPEISQPGTG